LTTLSLAPVYIFQICKRIVKAKSASIGSLFHIYIFTYLFKKNKNIPFTKIGFFVGRRNDYSIIVTVFSRLQSNSRKDKNRTLFPNISYRG
jgi:hypothetical protein